MADFPDGLGRWVRHWRLARGLTLNALAQESDIRPLPLKTLLVQLELRGVIAPRYSYFADYRFECLIESAALAERFQGERRLPSMGRVEGDFAPRWRALRRFVLGMRGMSFLAVFE